MNITRQWWHILIKHWFSVTGFTLSLFCSRYENRCLISSSCHHVIGHSFTLILLQMRVGQCSDAAQDDGNSFRTIFFCIFVRLVDKRWMYSWSNKLRRCWNKRICRVDALHSGCCDMSASMLSSSDCDTDAFARRSRCGYRLTLARPLCCFGLVVYSFRFDVAVARDSRSTFTCAVWFAPANFFTSDVGTTRSSATRYPAIAVDRFNMPDVTLNCSPIFWPT